MPATTVNYSWNLPTVGGDEDAWGGYLNSNWTALDTLLGGTNATEFAILDGATVTTTELNYVSGVTSAIQTQLDAKQAGDATLTALAGTLTAANKIPYATGTDTAGELNFVDEDNMSSDSATALPSQQSVKAYVDTQVAAVDVGGDYASDARDAIGQIHLYVYTVGYNGSNAFSQGSTYDGASIGQTSGQNWLCLSTSNIGVTFFGSEYNNYVNLFKRTS